MRAKQTRKFPDIKAKSDVLTFGKFRGMRIDTVLCISPSYLLWLQSNTDIKISQKILQEAWDNEFQRKIRQQIRQNFSIFDFTADND